MLPLPNISLIASQYPRLEQLARVAAQQGDMHAIFLMGEINRAEIVPDETDDAGSLVTVGCWVSYWTNWGVPPNAVQLAWPDECSSASTRISVLSPLGAALIGLKAGDQMPYFVAGCLNLVRVRSVSRHEPNVVPLFKAGVERGRTPFDDDPGPSAA